MSIQYAISLFFDSTRSHLHKMYIALTYIARIIKKVYSSLQDILDLSIQ